MEVAVEAKKDAKHYRKELRAFRRRHRHLKGVFLVQDGDPSHTAGAEYWSGCQGWWRPRFTPVHASWLNQAEPLIEAFAYHYLKRESWASREEFIEHVLASGRATLKQAFLNQTDTSGGKKTGPRERMGARSGLRVQAAELLLFGLLFLLYRRVLGCRLAFLGRRSLLFAEDRVIALGEVFGLGKADTNNAHEWTSLKTEKNRSRFSPSRSLAAGLAPFICRRAEQHTSLYSTV